MTNTSERDKQIALGEKFYNQGHVSQAAACFRLAVAADPQSAQAHAQLAWSLQDPTKTFEAIEHLRTASELDSSSEKVLESLASLLVHAGEFEEAEVAFRRALKSNPRSATSLCGVVACRKMREADRELVEFIAGTAAQPARPEKQRTHLHRAAGKAYDDLGEYEIAMRHFDESNRIAEAMAKKAGSVFAERELEQYTDLLISVFTAEQLKRPLDVGSNSELPVLIVGMIRTGTTLLDQILSRHPKIGSAGELNYWTGPGPGGVLRDLMRGKIDRGKAADVCAQYRIALRNYGPEMPRVIDKMPMNFMGLGLIHLLFPNAHIIHTRRNPVDTCLSIYVTELGVPRVNFAVSRHNIVSMYKQYLRLMDHWRSVIPANRLLEVNYEDVVANQEGEIRRVTEFLGLDWDPACLKVEGGASTIVSTPSVWQARQPIYRTSVERWRRYEPWLGEFAELLDEAEQNR